MEGMRRARQSSSAFRILGEAPEVVMPVVSASAGSDARSVASLLTNSAARC
jgi:hypothetical protein